MTARDHEGTGEWMVLTLRRPVWQGREGPTFNGANKTLEMIVAPEPTPNPPLNIIKSPKHLGFGSDYPVFYFWPQFSQKNDSGLRGTTTQQLSAQKEVKHMQQEVIRQVLQVGNNDGKQRFWFGRNCSLHPFGLGRLALKFCGTR